MAITDIIPWNRNRVLATRRQDVVDHFNMILLDISRVFGEFLTACTRPDRIVRILDRQMGNFMPEIDVKETDKEFRVTADLPGMDDKDLEVTVVDGALSIKREKREENEEEK